MVIETKLEYGDKIYFIHGNPKKSYAVYSATIHHVTIFETGVILYHFIDAKVEVDKDNITSDKCKLYGYFYEKDLDSGNSLRNELGLSALPVFSSKKLCKEYLKRQKHG